MYLLDVSMYSSSQSTTQQAMLLPPHQHTNDNKASVVMVFMFQINSPQGNSYRVKSSVINDITHSKAAWAV